MTKPVKKDEEDNHEENPNFTAFQKFVARVERSNKSFKKASPAKKIVMAPQEMLDILRLRRFAVTPGTYVSVQSQQRVRTRARNHRGRWRLA